MSRSLVKLSALAALLLGASVAAPSDAWARRPYRGVHRHARPPVRRLHRPYRPVRPRVRRHAYRYRYVGPRRGYVPPGVYYVPPPPRIYVVPAPAPPVTIYEYEEWVDVEPPPAIEPSEEAPPAGDSAPDEGQGASEPEYDPEDFEDLYDAYEAPYDDEETVPEPRAELQPGEPQDLFDPYEEAVPDAPAPPEPGAAVPPTELQPGEPQDLFDPYEEAVPDTPAAPEPEAAVPPAPLLVEPPGPEASPSFEAPAETPEGGLTPAARHALEAEIVRLINVERTRANLEPLVPEPHLHHAAVGHSEEMYRLGYFDHTSPVAEREKFTDRLNAAGLEKFGYAGENIALATPRDQVAAIFVQMWMDSPGHRRNILKPNYRLTGVGVWGDRRGVYATQLFASSVTPAATGAPPAPAGPTLTL